MCSSGGARFALAVFLRVFARDVVAADGALASRRPHPFAHVDAVDAWLFHIRGLGAPGTNASRRRDHRRRGPVDSQPLHVRLGVRAPARRNDSYAWHLAAREPRGGGGAPSASQPATVEPRMCRSHCFAGSPRPLGRPVWVHWRGVCGGARGGGVGVKGGGGAASAASGDTSGDNSGDANGAMCVCEQHVETALRCRRGGLVRNSSSWA